MVKEVEKKKSTPREEELSDRLSLKVIKAWKHLTRRLADSELLDEQKAKKGFFWRAFYYLPNKVTRYNMTKNTKKLYELSNEEYDILKALTNAYGVYNPDMYNSRRPMIDIREKQISKMKNGLEKALEDVEDAA